MPLIPVFGRQKGDLCEFQATLFYISSRQTTQTVSKKVVKKVNFMTYVLLILKMHNKI